MLDSDLTPQYAGDNDKPITVLLVDDNEQWARFIAREIEAEYPDIQVDLAGSPNEAMLRLDEATVDCVVADYQMPEVDGLQLLDRIRKERPTLPYILVTSEGSEDVASAAIDAGVSDYMIKDPRANQLTMVATKIRQAVESARLREAVAESERRYRLLTEQSRDAILIVQDSTLVFYNSRLVELTSRPRSWIEERRGLDGIVHPEDVADVHEVIDRWQNSPDGSHLHDLRLLTADGGVRHCEYTGQGISHDGEPAVMVSVRDVTDREQRERELRWERDLNRSMRNVLVTANTRNEIEQAAVDLLVEYGYALAWIGAPEDGTLTPRAQDGDTDYLVGVDRSLGDGEADTEPSLWAARSGETRFVPDLEELFPTDWREQALDRGYRSSGAIPLSYSGVSYGVLAVYHVDTGRFDETERQLLDELTDTLAFAIHTVETEQALASDHTVELTLRVADDAYYLVAAAREAGIVDPNTLGVRGTLTHTDGQQIQYISVEGEAVANNLQNCLDGHPAVAEVTTIRDGSETRLQVVTDTPTPESYLVERGGLVQSTTVAADGADIVVELPAREAVRRSVDRLQEAFDDVSMLSVTDTDRAGGNADEVRPVDMGHLTAKQAAALEAAFHHGYFEQPRGSSATEIADALGVAHSTFLQHLRAAQQKLFADLYR